MLEGALEAQTLGGAREALTLGGAREAPNWTEPAGMKVSLAGPEETKESLGRRGEPLERYAKVLGMG